MEKKSHCCRNAKSGKVSFAKAPIGAPMRRPHQPRERRKIQKKKNENRLTEKIKKTMRTYAALQSGCRTYAAPCICLGLLFWSLSLGSLEQYSPLRPLEASACTEIIASNSNLTTSSSLDPPIQALLPWSFVYGLHNFEAM